MSPVIKRCVSGNDVVGFSFHCPGCNKRHVVMVKSDGPTWQWNGSVTKPSFQPSILVNPRGPYHVESAPVCHSYVTDGVIRYLGDCTHDMANESAALPPVMDKVDE